MLLLPYGQLLKNGPPTTAHTVANNFFFSDESEVSLNNDDDNGSDFAPWKASQSPEPGAGDVTDGKKDDNKAELLKSTLKANNSK